MKKIIFYILTSIWIISSIFLVCNFSYAWVIDIPDWWDIEDLSITNAPSWDIEDMVNTTWISLLKTVKLILQWLLIFFIVYIWIQMIISMWSDEEELSKAKRQLWYSLIALVFINIPWTLFEAFNITNKDSVWASINWTEFTKPADWNNNIFINYNIFWETLFENVLWFIEIAILWVAVLMLVIAGIRILTSRWREEKIKEWKNKFVWSIIWLIMLALIEVYKWFVFTWDIWNKTSWWTWLFVSMINMALYIAWPIAIAFLTLAWYYYITSAWDDERIKKAKSIIINTIIATIILIASYTFLLDLITL